ncbi:Ger(x)C family spore germination C-terminal domain-containing protein [Lysinibacillus sp. NPDC048646]|uniref:Ger(x)C family spore germination C-terminal domain-containing protein n=1 Tax=Lysinibacillus sp. NPDC048646 TaxID=3390574 RepID=UPI003D0056E9
MDKVELMMKSMQKAFYHSSDFTVRQVDWRNGSSAILCFYASLVDAKEVQRILDTIYARLDTEKPYWSETLVSTLEQFTMPQAVERICKGETLIVLTDSGEMLSLTILNEVNRKTIKMDYTIDIEVDEFSHDKLYENNIRDDVQAMIQKKVQADFEEVLKILQEQKSDTLGVGRHIRSYHPKMFKEDWHEQFASLTLEPKVKVKIIRTGVLR